MENLTFEFVEKNIPKLGFGLMRLPLTNANDATTIDIGETKKMVDRYMSAGLNYFDTAYMYHGGKSEPAIREALVKRYKREDFFLANKLPVWFVNDNAGLDEIFNEQLQRCGVDYFDFYLLHSLGYHNDQASVKFEAYEYMIKLKKEGKARHIGFSFHDTPEILEEILINHPEMEFVQLQINYLDWNTRLRADEHYRIARKYNKPIIIMEPVRGGVLANVSNEVGDIFKRHNPDASVASWAIRFCASLDGVMTVLSGMTNMEQLNDNISVIKNFKKLDDTEHKVIKAVVNKFAQTDYVPCTACNYCSECPVGINIPEIFDIVNEYRQTNNLATARTQHSAIDKDKTADKCIACGQCESVCPQNINIIETLKYVSANFKPF